MLPREYCFFWPNYWHPRRCFRYLHHRRGLRAFFLLWEHFQTFPLLFSLPPKSWFLVEKSNRGLRLKCKIEWLHNHWSREKSNKHRQRKQSVLRGLLLID